MSRGGAGRGALLAAAVGIVTAIVFLPATRGEFVWDDAGLLGGEHYAAVDQWSDVIDAFGKPVTAGAGVAYYRPILMATFVADFQAAGPDPIRFHRTNVVLHALNAALVTILLLVLTGRGWPSAVGGLLFGLHPIQGQAVGLIMGRNDELLIPPLVAIMLADEWAERRGRRGLGAVAIALGYAVALWTKETAVVVPVLILLADLLWRGRAPRELLRRLPLLALLAVVTGLYFWTRLVVFGAILDAGQYGTLGPLGRLALATATLGYYLRLLAAPTGFAPAPYHAGLVDAGTAAFWTAAALVAGFAGVVAVTLRRMPHVAYGLLFFAIACLPVLGLGALMKLPMLEHRAYLPLLGIAIAAAAAAPRVGASWLGRLAVAALLVVWGVLTHQRLPAYQSSLALWHMAVTNVPASDYARNNYGAALMEADRIPEAIEHLEEGLRLNPDYWRARYNLAASFEAVNRRGDAIREMEELARRKPNDWAILNRLGLMRSRAGLTVAARDAYREAVAAKPDEPIVQRNLTDILVRLGEYGEAVVPARRLVELEPAKPDYWLRLASVLRRSGQPAEAATAYERALALGHDSAWARVELATALWEAGRVTEAAPHALRARELGAGDAPVMQLLRDAGLIDAE